MKILVINAGSSSLKYQLIDMESEVVMAKGLCERIGIDGHLKHSPLVGDKPVFNEDVPMPTHSEAIAAVIDKLTSKEYGVVGSMKEIDAVGHRVVHGGEKFASSVLINDEVMKAIEEKIKEKYREMDPDEGIPEEDGDEDFDLRAFDGDED